MIFDLILDKGKKQKPLNRDALMNNNIHTNN